MMIFYERLEFVFLENSLLVVVEYSPVRKHANLEEMFIRRFQ